MVDNDTDTMEFHRDWQKRHDEDLRVRLMGRDRDAHVPTHQERRSCSEGCGRTAASGSAMCVSCAFEANARQPLAGVEITSGDPGVAEAIAHALEVVFSHEFLYDSPCSRCHARDPGLCLRHPDWLRFVGGSR